MPTQVHSEGIREVTHPQGCVIYRNGDITKLEDLFYLECKFISIISMPVLHTYLGLTYEIQDYRKY